MVALKYLGATAVFWLSVISSGLASSVNEAEDLALRGDAHEQVLARDVDIGVEKRDEGEELGARDLYLRRQDPNPPRPPSPRPPPPPPPPNPAPIPPGQRRTGGRDRPPPRLIHQRDLDYLDHLRARHYEDMLFARSLYLRRQDPNPPRPPSPRPPPPPPPPNPAPIPPGQRRTGGRDRPPPRLIHQRDLDYLDYLEARYYEDGLYERDFY